MITYVESFSRPGWTFLDTGWRGDYAPIWRRSPWRVAVGWVIFGGLVLWIAWGFSR